MSVNKYGLDLNIGELWYVPFWQSIEFKITALLVILLALAGICFWWRKSRRKASKPLDPMLVALYKLEQLQLEVDTMESQKFYLGLTLNLKNWIKHRYNLNSLSDTDSELLQALETVQVDDQLKTHIRDVLESSIASRFAKAEINRCVMRFDVDRLVEILKKIPPVGDSV